MTAPKRSWHRAWQGVVVVTVIAVPLFSACQGTEGPLISLATAPTQVLSGAGGAPPVVAMRDASTSGVAADPPDASPPPVDLDAGGVDACQPSSCSSLAAECGAPSDGCSGVLSCGTCEPGYYCDVDYHCLPADECVGSYSQALLCESFEAPSDDYVMEQLQGTAELVSSPTYQGMGAFSLSTDGGQSRARGRATIANVASGSLHFRTYLQVPPNMVSDIVKIFAIEANPPSPNVDIVLQDDESVGVFFQADATEVRSAPGKVLADTWMCLQGEVVLSDTVGSVKLWLDGDLVVDTDPIFDTLPATGIETIFFGIHWTGPNEDTAQVYMDNLVFDRAPVGCF